MHPILPILGLFGALGAVSYLSLRDRERHQMGPALPPGPPPPAPPRRGPPRRQPSPPPPGPAPYPQPGAAAIAWAPDPGMPTEYQTAVWTALTYERDPNRLRMFGDRMRELNMHRSAAALQNRAAQMEHGAHGAFGQRGHGGYAPTPHTRPNAGTPVHPSQWH